MTWKLPKACPTVEDTRGWQYLRQRSLYSQRLNHDQSETKGTNAMRLSWDSWQPKTDALHITTIDAHAAGEPLRIVTGGLPELPGATILERRRYMQKHLDHVRRALMWEPRGHYNMYGCIVTPPVTS